MKTLVMATVLLFATMVMAQSTIIPVSSWPKTVVLDGGKITYNASVDTCVKAGYRLLPAKPATPTGKRIKSESVVQDDKKIEMCKYVILYEDIPIIVKPVVVPDVLTNVSSEKVTFNFTTGGVFRSITWLDAPKSNVVVTNKIMEIK